MTPDQLKAARTALALTQGQLAVVIGRTIRNVQQWEGGERLIDPSAARLIAAYLAGYRPNDWPTGKARTMPGTVLTDNP